MLHRIDTILAGLERRLIVLLFSMLILSIVFNVFSRDLFMKSYGSITEFSPGMVLWLALLGSSLAIRDNRHIKIEILLRFVPNRFSILIKHITAVFGMLIMAMLFYASLEFVRNEISIFGIKGGISVIFPVFFLVAVFRFFLKLLAPDSPSRSLQQGEDTP